MYGIANPQPLKNYISENTAAYEEISYSDHHIFSIDDLKNISKKFEKIKSANKFILTTEKDAVRLIKFKEQLTNLPLYVLPVSINFYLMKKQFLITVTDFITGFKKEIINEAKKIKIKTSFFASLFIKRCA